MNKKIKTSLKPTDMSRRSFLKVAGATGLGSMVTPLDALTELSAAIAPMPTRPFGKTGFSVPILSLGTSLHLPQILLHNAFRWGVTHWDTANSYMGGNSEARIGQYFAKRPEHRKQIFLVTKSGAWTLRGMSDDLETSLERMKTDYIDLFFVHGINDIDDLDDDTRRWAEKHRASGKIRFFGFSTHSNMAECLLGAAELGWIDGIMMTYNYRLMHTDRMKRAVDACARAGIGLTAMKTQGGGSVKTNSDRELELAGRFLTKGFTDAQAKLKAVWENEHIATICSEMPNMSILMENVAAAHNRTRLSAADLNLLDRYARETRADYCGGCRNLCEPVLAAPVPVGDIMRALMYWRSYGDRVRARRQFDRIPADIRSQIASIDYAPAEKRCPRQMQIGKLIREAVLEFS